MATAQLSSITPIICTGFHRSGTSLTAQILQKAGVNLGSQLMKGGFSNPDGHFEDMEAIKIHDRLLQKQGLTWKATEPVPPKLDIAKTAIQQYINQRQEQNNPYWGIKDPRLSLFLPYWQQALPSNAVFVLPIRHWTECVQSLQQRHAKIFAYNIFPNPVTANQLSFWRDPLLSAKMWLNYNLTILQFVQQNPDKVFILPHNQLLQGYDFIYALNNKFGLSLAQVDYDNIIQSDYHTASHIMDMVIDSLPATLVSELDELYAQLMSFAEKGLNTEITIKPKTINQSQWRQAESIINQVNPTNKIKPSTRNIENIASLNFQQINNLIGKDNVIHNESDTDYLLALCQRAIRLNPFHWQCYEWIGRVHIKRQEYSKALNHIKIAISLTDKPPANLHYLLSQVCLSMERYGWSRKYIDIAIQKNPNNPAFYIQKKNVLTLMGKDKLANEVIDSAHQKLPNNAHIKVHYLEQLLATDSRQAISEAKQLWQESHEPQIGTWLSDRLVEQKTELNLANGIKQQLMIEKFQNADITQWLMDIAKQIEDDKQAIYLLYLILQAWDKFGLSLAEE